MFSARPAAIIEQIEVGDHIPASASSDQKPIRSLSPEPCWGDAAARRAEKSNSRVWLNALIHGSMTFSHRQ
jgi:hypothetical protein